MISELVLFPAARSLAGMNSTKQVKFRVAAVSANANSFGLHGHVLVDETGRAFEAGRSRGAHLKALSHRDELTFTEQLRADGTLQSAGAGLDWAAHSFEIPRQIADAPKEVIADLFKPTVHEAAAEHFARQGDTKMPAEPPVSTRTIERPFDAMGFVLAVETGALSQEEIEADAQKLVDSGVWRHLQGSWQRTVRDWADAGIVTL